MWQVEHMISLFSSFFTVFILCSFIISIFILIVNNDFYRLYNSENFSETSLPTIDDAIETTATVNSKKSDRQVLKPTIIALVGSVIFIYVMSYFGIDYSAFINFSKNFTQ